MEHRHLPLADQLSVLAAIILLAYALARLAYFPANEIAFQFPGIYLNFELNLRTVIALLVAGLTASGADWLLRQHPAIQQRSTVEHWLLPGLTAWVIGIPLLQLPLGPGWWLSFVVGGALLMLVLVAEYITIDREDARYPAASAGLTAVSFALLLMLAISLRSSGIRLFLILPALAFATGLVSLRTLHLRLGGRWALLQTGVLVLIFAQLLAGLYYLPLAPVPFGLILLGIAYGLTSLVANLADGARFWRALIEPSIILIVVCGAALWLS